MADYILRRDYLQTLGICAVLFVVAWIAGGLTGYRVGNALGYQRGYKQAKADMVADFAKNLMEQFPMGQPPFGNKIHPND